MYREQMSPTESMNKQSVLVCKIHACVRHIVAANIRILNCCFPDAQSASLACSSFEHGRSDLGSTGSFAIYMNPTFAAR